MRITIDTRSTTTGVAATITDFAQEVDGEPVDFIQAMEELDRGETEPMFGEDGNDDASH